MNIIIKIIGIIIPILFMKFVTYLENEEECCSNCDHFKYFDGEASWGPSHCNLLHKDLNSKSRCKRFRRINFLKYIFANHIVIFIASFCIITFILLN